MVSGILVINAIISFTQKRRAAGVVATLKRRPQISAHVLRDVMGTLAAAGISSMLPGFVCILLVQRYIVRGLTLGIHR